MKRNRSSTSKYAAFRSPLEFRSFSDRSPFGFRSSSVMAPFEFRSSSVRESKNNGRCIDDISEQTRRNSESRNGSQQYGSLTKLYFFIT